MNPEDDLERCDICGEEYQGYCTDECEKIIRQIDAWEDEQSRKYEQALFKHMYGSEGAIIL